MGTADAVIQRLGSQEFNAELYDSVSLTAKLAAAVANRAQVMRIAYSLHKANRSIKTMLDSVDNILAGKESAKFEAGESSPFQTQNVIENLAHISRMLDYTSEMMKRARLTNNSLTAGALKKLQDNGESIKDLLDWFDAASKPEELQKVFNRAKEERESGDLVDLPRGN